MTANVTYRLSTAGVAPVSTTNKNAPLTNAEIDGNLKSILTDLDLKATIASPTFTGTPTSVTPSPGDNTTKIATTEFVSTNTVLKTDTPATGAFDTTITVPTGTTRLNYGGSFYPTTINLSGTTDSAIAATHYFVETGSDGVVRPKTLADVKTEIVTTAAVNSVAATTVGTVTSGTWSASTIAPNKGGTGLASYGVGDLVYASGTTTLSTLSDIATGSALISGGAGVAPSYGKIGLTTHVTGTLSVGSGGTGQTTQQAAINVLAGGVANATYLRGNGTNVVMSAIQAGDVPTLNQNTTGTATNAINLNGTGTSKVAATEGYGYGLWNSTPITYGMLMSATSNVTYGGRNSGETTSDYNMYFTMAGGTNRGFVFRSAYGTNLFSVNPDGLRSALTLTVSSVNGITGLGGVPSNLAVSAAAGTATTVSRSDHVHAFPTAANVGLGNVTNESKATMFASPTFTGTATAANLTVTGDLTISGTTTSVNSTTLDVADINITVAKNATTAAAANGAGLTIGNYASNPTLLYGSASDNFTFNRAVLGTSFNGITGFDATVPIVNDTAAAGSATTAAKRDHRHPTETNIRAVSYGGTGVSTITGVVYGTGTTAMRPATAAEVVAVISTTAVANATTATALVTTNSYTGVNFTSTGKYLAANGTAALPSITFSSDTDTGMYWSTAGGINFTSNGVLAGSIASGGTLTMVSSITAYSDSRLKTNLERIPDALNKIDQLNGYTFDRTDIDVPRQTGVIAQEVLKVLPEAVLGSEDTTYSVAYGNMVGLLIEAIKELRAEVKELRGMK